MSTKAPSWLPQLDAYTRVARFYPVLLATAPLLWTSLSPKPVTDAGGHLNTLATLGVVGAAIALFTNIARAQGKALEPKLLAAWGGWRTTAMLRHRDTYIDRTTKARYHVALEKLSKGLKLPSAGAEAAAPDEADELYRSATLRLIEKRRDRKYTLLHNENAQYGFRRNLLGLKPFALSLLAVCVCVELACWWLGLPATPLTGRGIIDAVGIRWPIVASIGADLLCVVVWLVAVRPSFVRRAADEYALALFRTLDA